MSTKLKRLKISKVDFVDAGANPDAYISLYKRKDGQSTTEENPKKESIWKRLFKPLAKLAGVEQEELDTAVEAIEKGEAVSFSEKLSERKTRKIADEIWDLCFALEDSLVSILRDEELDSEASKAAMNESVSDFNTVIEEAITSWSSKKAANISKNIEALSADQIENIKSARERLDMYIQKADKPADNQKSTTEEGNGSKEEKNTNKPKGENEEMKIDKSKMSPEEKNFLEAIEKKYGVAEEVTDSEQTPAAPIEKGATVQQTEQPAEDIYKGMSPEAKEELIALKKFREETEEKELHQLAKKYTIIGKKEEDLVPLFKSLKAAGGTAFDDMRSMLDSMVSTVEKSGIFSEIGKSGGTGGAVLEPEGKIESIAKNYMETDPNLSYVDAVAKAWENNPNLIEEYDKEAGF